MTSDEEVDGREDEEMETYLKKGFQIKKTTVNEETKSQDAEDKLNLEVNETTMKEKK
jgi:hypothetical protein